jgi:hypothetical protein
MRKEEVLAAGGKFAKESLEEICDTLDFVVPTKNPFGRSDIWFPNYPQIVIKTNQKSAYVYAMVRKSGTKEMITLRVIDMHVGEWGMIDGRPFFVTSGRISSSWKGNGPWPFLEMCFPNLPTEI